MPVISQVTAHVTTHCTSMSYLSCQFYVTGFHVWRNDMLMMSQLSSTMMSQMQPEVSVTVMSLSFNSSRSPSISFKLIISILSHHRVDYWKKNHFHFQASYCLTNQQPGQFHPLLQQRLGDQGPLL